MSRISEGEIERIRCDTDLVALVRSRGIALERQGAEWIGACPFHKDSGGRDLIVTPGQGLFRCMAGGCGKAGDAIHFVEWSDGVSFRHAFEVLAERAEAAPAGGDGKPKAKRATIPKLECPLGTDADGEALIQQVADYYHKRLDKAQAAKEYLATRGLYDEGLVRRFRIGFADRTLGLRMPNKQRAAGAELRARLTALGVYRKSGHEHLTGCVVIPVADLAGGVRQLYGRRIDPRAPKDKRHLYLAGPLAGLFNPATLGGREIILCGSIIDVLTFYKNGMEAATCTLGTRDFNDELLGAIEAAKVESVRLAYGADEAGDNAAAEAARKLEGIGVEVHRVRFPIRADANSYAIDQGGEALRRAVKSAEWLSCGRSSTPTRPPEQEAANPMDGEEPSQRVSAGGGKKAPGIAAPLAAGSGCPPSGLAATRKGSPEPVVDRADAPEIEKKGDFHELKLGDRLYRAGGLEKNNGLELLKVTLRVMGAGGLFHIDALDLYRDGDRKKFVARAAEETGLEKDLIKRDLGKLLLALERLQEERLAGPGGNSGDAPELTAEEERAVLEFARAPDLMGRIGEALGACGLVGERNNGLAIYLCATSRLLPKPLAAMIQSTSAAGKTTLMEAVLDLFPCEEKVKYSAMTGQSLYYMAEKSLKNKVLAVVEEEGAGKASYALKLLQSEQELRIASTGKDPHTGRMETQEYHVEGPAAIVLATTSVDIDEELMNRCLVLSVDESKEQTERIQKAQREAETPEGIVAAEEGDGSLCLLRNFQRSLRPVRVANPFGSELTFTAERTRTRRDHTKYLGLIKTIALLHQHSRETIKRKTAAGKEIELLPITIEDIEAANEIAPEVLGRSLDELPPQTRRLLEAAKKLVREKMKAEDKEQRFAQFTRREIRERVGWAATQTRIHLERLAELEYVIARNGRNGAAFQYELMIGADEPESVAHIGLADTEKLRKKHNYGGNLTGEKTT